MGHVPGSRRGRCGRQLPGPTDERGNQIEEAYFGLDGKPCLHKKGYHRWTARYNERGNSIETTYFGLDGKKVVSPGDNP